MEREQVEVNGKNFTIHELLATEFDEIQEEENSTKRVVELIKKSADLSDEDYSKLTLKERSQIQKVINKLNGWEDDFQKLETEEKK